MDHRGKARSLAVAFVTVTSVGLLLASEALAKRLCLEDADGFAWVFPAAKLPKKVGRVTDLSGYTRSPLGQIGTVSGTAVRLTGDALAVGVKPLRWGVDSVVGATYLGTVDTELAGELVQENTFPPQTLTLVAKDCDTIPDP